MLADGGRASGGRVSRTGSALSGGGGAKDDTIDVSDMLDNFMAQ